MPIDRRSFLVASATGYAGLRLGNPTSLTADDLGPAAVSRANPALKGGIAKSVICFLCGGASHIDTWDMKPDAPSEYRGPFTDSHIST